MDEQLADAGLEATEGRRKSRQRVTRRRSRVGHFQNRLRELSARVLTGALLLIVVSSLLAVGSVHTTTLLVIAPFAILAGVFALFVEEELRWSTRLPAIAGIVLSGYCLLQSAPLPPRLVASLSPASWQIWHDALRLTGGSVARWMSLSVDPGASRVEALKWLSYSAIYLAGARLARERGSQRGAIIVVSAALVGGCLSIAHGLAGLDAWFGLYQPVYARPVWALTPLLNPNNFAGYLNLALFTGLGLLFVREPAIPRWGVAIVVAFLAAQVILTASRAGVVAMLIGFCLAGAAFHRQQRRSRSAALPALPIWLPIAGVSAAALGLAVVGGTQSVWQALFEENLEKLRIIDYSRPLVRDYFWTGVGRGAFETAFPAYRVNPGNGIAQYAENFIVQWVVEWGLPVALAALLTLGWSMRPRRFGFGRNAVPTGIYVAVWVLLVQNLVDLGTEIASIGLALALLLGTLTGGAEYVSARRGLERSKRGLPAPAAQRPTRRFAPEPLLAGLLLAAGLSLTGIVALVGHRDAIAERWDLAQRLLGMAGQPQTSPQIGELRQAVDEALLRHPADPHIPIIGAMLVPRTSRQAMSWLSHALRRDKMGARPHILLAESLAARGATNQALLELRRTFELGPELVNEVADRAVRWSTTTEQLLRAVPDGKSGIPLLNGIAQRIPATSPSSPLRAELLADSLRRDPANIHTNTISAEDLLSALDERNSPCQDSGRSDCEGRLQRHVSAIASSVDPSHVALLLKGRLLARDGKFDEAERLLMEHCPQVHNPAHCNASRVLYAMKLPDPSRLDDAVSNYAASACRTPVECANAYSWLGDLEMQKGNARAALARYERAAQENPSTDAWLRVANVALGVNRLGRAETALAAARRLSDVDGSGKLEEVSKRMQRARLLQELDAPTPKHP